jgi:formylglycine-generating enzyme required for sulfatase activity/uncharacterized caspase-like protein
MRTRTWVAFYLLLTAAFGVHAETRVALVIGNGAYASGALANPVNDAHLLRDTLKADGFVVTYLANADRAQMVRAIQTLGQELAGGGKEAVGLFYFSGHGVQSEGHNFLLPVKASINSDADLLPEAVDVEWVLKQMEQAHNGLDIVILDACRNNPLPARMRDALKGLAAMQAPPGSVVAFATDAGSVASDGGGTNSPYAAALARYMQEPGLELKAMFDAVARNVFDATKNTPAPQIPVQTYKLTPSFYFRAAAVAPASAPAFDSRAAELALWQSAVSLETVDAYRAYLEQYPNGQFSTMAKLKIAGLTRLAGGGMSSSSSNGPKPGAPPVSPHRDGETLRDCADVCPEMVVIPPGRFQMGSPSNEQGRLDDEGPVHAVHISYAFAVGKYPVTRGQWRSFLRETGRTGSRGCFTSVGNQWEQKPEASWLDPGFPQEDSHPAVCMTWSEGQDYATWLSTKTGHHYRLLTEAEYEYINRAGTSSAYIWGGTSDGQCSYANGADAAAKVRYGFADAADCNDGYAFTSPVGKFKPNRFGLYDTTGNVWSWTEDCYHENYGGAPTDGSAWATGGDCSWRVVRGGSWIANPLALLAAKRTRSDPSYGIFDRGLRLARDND